MEHSTDTGSTASRAREATQSSPVIQQAQKIQLIVESFEAMFSESLSTCIASLIQKTSQVPGHKIKLFEVNQTLKAISLSASADPHLQTINKQFLIMVSTLNDSDINALDSSAKDEDVDAFLKYFFEHGGMEKLTDLTRNILMEAVPDATKDQLIRGTQLGIKMLTGSLDIKVTASSLGSAMHQ